MEELNKQQQIEMEKPLQEIDTTVKKDILKENENPYQLDAQQINQNIHAEREEQEQRLHFYTDKIIDGRQVNAAVKEKGIEKVNAYSKRHRTLANALLDSTKFLGDSKEMVRVKNSVREVEEALAQDINKEDFDNYITGLERKYVTAINHCQYYLANKTTLLGDGRYRKVHITMSSLISELGLISTAKGRVKESKKIKLDDIQTGKDLLNFAHLDILFLRGREERRANAAPEQAPAVQQAATERFSRLTGSAKAIYGLLTGATTPSEVQKKMGADGKDLAIALYNTIKQFPPVGDYTQYIHTAFFAYNGKAYNRYEKNEKGKTVLGNTLMAISQSKDGVLSVKIVDNNGQTEIPLSYGRKFLLNNLQRNIVENEEVFGREFTRNELGWLRKKYGDMTLEEQSSLRDTAADYIINRTGLASKELELLENTDIQKIAVEVMENNLDIAGVKDQIRIYKATYSKFEYNHDQEWVKFAEMDEDEALNLIVGGPEEEIDETGKRVVKEEIREEKIDEWVVVEETDQTKSLINKQAVLDKLKISQANKELQSEAVRVNIVQQEEQGKKEEKMEEAVWTESEAKIKNLFADLIYSKDTWTSDKYVKEGAAKGERIKKTLIEHADALVALVKDKTLLEKFIDRFPMPVGKTEIKTEISILLDKAEAEIGAEKLTAAKIMPDFMLRSAIVSQIENTEDEVFADVESKIDSFVDVGSEMIQKEVDACVDGLFSGRAGNVQEPPIPNPNEPGISAEEKKQRIALGEKRLNKIITDAMAGGVSGLSLFMKNVMKNYFTNVDTIDKRSMLAAALREAKPILKKQKKEENKGGLLGFFGGLMNVFNNKEEEKPEEKSEEELLLEKQENEELFKEQAGSFVGGFLKGAGPLFQKLLQGLPVNEDSPKFLKDALADIKSRLLPIPQEIVDAQLFSMVQNSKGEVTKIEITRRLGAASVGQAFLAKIYGPNIPEGGREVVIKLLRPDVQNRMQREKAIMLRCAEETNAGMRATYLGQLARIEEELDLKIEANNVKLGAVYDKTTEANGAPDNVTAMKLCNLIEPTTDYMVVDKSKGDTVDDYLEIIDKKKKDILKDFLIKKEGKNEDKPEYEKDENGEYKLSFTLDNHDKLLEAEKKIAELIDATTKRSVKLACLAKKWVQEGLFGEGFYHGDLHAGNIMVSEDSATFIDFGNATKLDDEQKLQITRMMVAASIGKVDTFRSGFHALMDKDEQSEANYQAKKAQFTAEIKKILSLAGHKQAGQRIGAILIKAQELGLALPASIQNFSTCQIRLENTMRDVNNQITQLTALRDQLRANLTHRVVDTNNAFSVPMDYAEIIMREQKGDAMKVIENFKLQFFKMIFNEETLLQRVYNSVTTKAQLEELLGSFYSNKYSVTVPDMFDELENNCQTALAQKQPINLKREKIYPLIVKYCEEKSKDNSLTDEQKRAYENPEAFLKLFTVNQGKLTEAQLDQIDEIKDEITQYFGNKLFIAQLGMIMTDKIEGKYTVTEERDEGYEKFKDFINKWKPLVKNVKQIDSSLDAPKVTEFEITFMSAHMNDNSIEIFNKSLEKYFNNEKYGAKLRAEFEKYYAAKREHDRDSSRENYEKFFQASRDAFYALVYVQMQMLTDLSNGAIQADNAEERRAVQAGEIKSFTDIMGDVIDSNLSTAIRRLGVFWSLINKSKLRGLSE